MWVGIILAIIFGVLALNMNHDGWALFAAILGFFIGILLNLINRIKVLEARLNAISNAEVTTPITKLDTEKPVGESTEIISSSQEVAVEIETPPTYITEQVARPIPSPPIQNYSNEPTPSYPPDVFDSIAGYITRFFTDGNVFAKVGLIVLFFGIGFLVKYAAERHYFPVEIRFVFAAIIGLVLLVLGWRMRQQKTTFALLLQGGGVGVLYVTIFAAAKLFTLVPLALALFVMIALVVFSAMLAILQNAKYLAMFAAAGGFLAPVLTSTGGGSHIMLFSYYALINLGIISIAWYRSWRELNLLGFIFTFVIGLSWGYKYYQPEYFVSVEPFLILFFVMFVLIAVLFATRQSPQLKGYVDATLVFGVPIVAFGLQAQLIKNIEYGIALSALGLSAVYVSLAIALWKRHAAGLRLLTEAFLALGVIFGTLTIPLALDGHWTSAAWALEGAALIWVGIRQQRLLARLFGILLQIAAGIAFMTTLVEFLPVIHLLPRSTQEIPIVNSTFLGSVLISLAGLFSSYILYKNRNTLREFEEVSHIFMLVWGLVWWFSAGYREIHYQLIAYHGSYYLANSVLLFISLSVLLMLVIEKIKNWETLRYPVQGLIGVMIYTILILTTQRHEPLLDMVGMVAWPMSFIVQYLALYLYRQSGQSLVLKWLHGLTAWLLLYLVCHESAWAVRQVVQGASWQDAMWLIIPVLTLIGFSRWGKKVRWPFHAHYNWYLQWVFTPVVLLVWLLAMSFALLAVGDPWPLSMYIPLLNPTELVVCFAIMGMLFWSMELQHLLQKINNKYDQYLRYVPHALAILGFALINGIVARSIHFWLDVPFHLSALSHSVEFQSVLSVVWTLMSLLLTVIATRQARRGLWFVGSGLLVGVVIKLFLFDLANSGTLARIVSFISVGILLLLINHFSPIPPKNAEGKT